MVLSIKPRLFDDVGCSVMIAGVAFTFLSYVQELSLFARM